MNDETHYHAATSDRLGDVAPDDAFAARVETYEDRPAECTVFPVDVAPAERLTTWISAREGSFVRLAEMR